VPLLFPKVKPSLSKEVNEFDTVSSALVELVNILFVAPLIESNKV
jgi:hypothetical protein